MVSTARTTTGAGSSSIAETSACAQPAEGPYGLGPHPRPRITQIGKDQIGVGRDTAVAEPGQQPARAPRRRIRQTPPVEAGRVATRPAHRPLRGQPHHRGTIRQKPRPRLGTAEPHQRGQRLDADPRRSTLQERFHDLGPAVLDRLGRQRPRAPDVGDHVGLVQLWTISLFPSPNFT
ncbi:hypothetical protein GCM10010466_08460 [Planomonospora alba]|uniref:Uncharacterized protein n=1 Tax=Planomonospora alba TaxID=161354 RepID=A0ABP6MN03_9ACTN